MAAPSQDLSALAAALGVVLPVGLSEAETLVVILQKVQETLADHEDRIVALEP